MPENQLSRNNFLCSSGSGAQLANSEGINTRTLSHVVDKKGKQHEIKPLTNIARMKWMNGSLRKKPACKQMPVGKAMPATNHSATPIQATPWPIFIDLVRDLCKSSCGTDSPRARRRSERTIGAT